MLYYNNFILHYLIYIHFIYYLIIDYNKFRYEDFMVRCPFDENHVMSRTRFQFHVINCKQEHMTSNHIECPYNSLHIMLKEHYNKHVEVCPNNPERTLGKTGTDVDYITAASLQRKYCNFCERSFTSSTGLRMLVEKVHLEEIRKGFKNIERKEIDTSLERSSTTPVVQKTNSQFGFEKRDWKVGEVVLARYTLDGNWYKAFIDKINMDGRYQVRYDGYNHSEILSWMDIRKWERS